MESRANELLQELYFNLKNLWEKGVPFPKQKRVELIKNIVKEYEES